MTRLIPIVMLAFGCQAGMSPSHGGGDGGTMPGGPGPVSCTPSCGSATCGNDGCGGLCGSCASGQLCTGGSCAAIPQGLTVDVAGDNHPIHPEIYGVAFVPPQALADLHLTVDRWGGNSVTLYNWQSDVSNKANDWFFENIPSSTATNSADQLILDAQSAHAAPLITIPTIGWTPKDRIASHPYTCGFPVEVYGAQQKVDPWDSHCGNGHKPDGTPLAANPINDAMTVSPAFEAMWLAHLVSRFGGAKAGGVPYYSLDNEMMLWDSTHADVRTKPVSFDDAWNATVTYAPLIKQADADAFVLGYGTWGVLDLFWSGLDHTNGLQDRQQHAGKPLAQWYLEQLAAYAQQHGQRLVDCLDIHYYPQGGDPMQNTRSLWDPNYRDPSWLDGTLNEPIQLLPRVADWIKNAYPGTGICITEYNFYLGDEGNPKAALATADTLGIFGKYGVRLATFWSSPVDGKGQPLGAYYAFSILRNYDGSGGAFGETSVAAASTLDSVSIYAATDAAGRLTILVINEGSAAQTTTLALRNFTAAAPAQVYRYVAQTGATVQKQADEPVNAGSLSLTLPALSMTMLVIGKM
jgi:hypothetical protein